MILRFTNSFQDIMKSALLYENENHLIEEIVSGACWQKVFKGYICTQAFTSLTNVMRTDYDKTGARERQKQIEQVF